ncbi:MAG: glycosyltransferase family 1 protein, partial [Gemmatimonadetes bacterium]|nr:glycosyltransferase family 1 protein [Gemmatimonadota bacterium]
GQGGPQRAGDGFNMTVLAFRLSSYRNGVSKLHGEVSRNMWQSLWPGLPKNEIPIESITNGVHIASHISQQMRALEDNYMGPRRLEEPHDQSVWETIDHIPPEELWRVHERRRERLVAFARQRLRKQLQRETASSIDMARADEVLTADALTIGFARRFATYKRATLLFHDLERLTRILCNEERPVQVIFAGKAHPQDHAGKEFIQEIFSLTQREYLHRRLVFIENYDMCVARYLVQGVDIWLNTPMRPQEASGTSGMKAVANGALNLSVLDGWWAEAYQPELGWEIGHGKEYDDPAYQNQIEARAIYNILEKEAVPLFYTRGVDGLPRGWIARMKNAMRVLCPKFNTHRMVQEYTERFYLKAHARSRDLSDDNGARARALAEWKDRVRHGWKDVAIRSVTSSQMQTSHVGDKIEIRADVALGDLTVEDAAVEIFHGQVGTEGQIVQGESLPMVLVDPHTFVGHLPLQKSGRWGYTVRIRPHHEDLNSICDTGLITWA